MCDDAAHARLQVQAIEAFQGKIGGRYDIRSTIALETRPWTTLESVATPEHHHSNRDSACDTGMRNAFEIADRGHHSETT